MKKAFGLTEATVFVLACSVACGGSVKTSDIDGTGGVNGTGNDRDGDAASAGGARNGAGTGSNGGGSGAKGGNTGANGGAGARSSGGTASGGGAGGTAGRAGNGGNTGSGGDLSSRLPPDIRTKPTVWIGQTNFAATLPEWVDPEKSMQPQKVVLILAPIVDDESVRGTVTFGDGPPPPAPKSVKATFPPKGGFYPADLAHFPYAGFEYSIVLSVLTNNHLTLAYVPSELFRDWCALFQPDQPIPAQGDFQVCECSDTECHTVTEPTDHFDLVVDGDSMGGTLSATTSDQSTVVEVRLKRVN